MARGFGRGKAPTTTVNGAQAKPGGAATSVPATDEVKGQVLVPSDRVGKIIGRGGQKIKDIQNKSGAVVKVSDDMEGNCKIVYLKGSATSVQKAEEIISSILNEVRDDGDDGRQSLDLWIPEDKCGLVIGSRGSKIREIQGDSGARVNVGRRDTAEDGMIRVSCTGSVKACEAAKQIIEELTADYPEGDGGDTGNFGDNTPEKVVEIYIPVDKCGKVIGSRGSKIHEIQDDTGAQVDVGRKDTAINGRILVTLSGSKEGCALAKETIESLVSETGEVSDSSESLEMWIKEKKCGLVIGSGGSQIKDIQIDSGARVKIGKRDTATGGMVLVTLSGTLEQCESAKRIIEDLTAEKDTSGRFGGEGAFGGMAGAGENRIELWVPEKKCGLIIGKGGQKISEIQQQTGTRVNVNGRDTSEDGKCLVTVSGSAEDCAAAEEIIQQLVMSENSGAGGGGGGGGDRNRSVVTDQGSLDVWVETTKLGRVIGKGGFQIREIENNYGVRVDIKKDEVMEYDTKVILTGSEEATMAAKDFIYELVDSE